MGLKTTTCTPYVSAAVLIARAVVAALWDVDLVLAALGAPPREAFAGKVVGAVQQPVGLV